MKLCFWLMLLIATRSVLVAASSQDFECHPSCETCTGNRANPNKCLTCADGSPVTRIDDDDDVGFCGEPCPTCYDSLIPTESDITYNGWDSWDNRNCSAGSVPLSANSEECSWEQKITYMECGCPKLPPLPQNDTTERCPICADGSDPSNPNATVDLGHEMGVTTCNRLADAFAYRRRDFEYPHNGLSGIITKGSYECSLEQHNYYKECGCPEPEIHEDACTLCYDRSPVASEFAQNDYWPLDSSLSSSLSCAKMDARTPWSTSRDDEDCRKLNELGAKNCGCNRTTTPAPTSSASVGSISKIPATICTAVLLMYWS